MGVNGCWMCQQHGRYLTKQISARVCVCVDAFMLFSKLMLSYYLFNVNLCVLHVHTHTEVSLNTSDNRKCIILSPFLFSFLFLTFVMES